MPLVRFSFSSFLSYDYILMEFPRLRTYSMLRWSTQDSYSTLISDCPSPWLVLICSTSSRSGNFGHLVRSWILLGSTRMQLVVRYVNLLLGAYCPVCMFFSHLPSHIFQSKQLLTYFFGGFFRYNEPIMKPEHHWHQDTNDLFMANI